MITYLNRNIAGFAGNVNWYNAPYTWAISITATVVQNPRHLIRFFRNGRIYSRNRGG